MVGSTDGSTIGSAVGSIDRTSGTPDDVKGTESIRPGSFCVTAP